ncbi:hypothetical protein AcW1_005887 [Taiwanofungus camphoratus]|nr:hypothetical protein AcW2_004642 [Antrodia cinnamomea]KAI0957519.1 hypothetical protein AcW1_005887 [Antrodia cinnamomea]
MPVWFSLGFCEIVRMNNLESVSAISVDKFEAVSQHDEQHRRDQKADTLSAKTIRPQSVFPRSTRPTHWAAFRIASKPRNSDSRMRYASLRYSRRALRMRLSVY